MTDKTHWPFGGNPWDHGSKKTEREAATKAQPYDQATVRQHIRHDRLIVGGRAHVKKSGLS
jgi:hypothetical protein